MSGSKRFCEMQPSEVFARKASGLMRSVDVLGALAAASSIAAISWAFVWQPILAAATFPGSDMGIAAIIALIFVIPQILLYSLMASALPRSGGDYVWVSRISGPAFAVGVYAIGFLNLIVNLVIQYYTFSVFYVPGLLYVMGDVGGNTGLVQFANALASPAYPQTLALVVCTVLVVVFVTLNSVRMQAVMAMTKWLWILTVVLSAALIAGVALTPHEAFVNYVGKQTYDSVISTAANLGYGIPAFSWAATIAAVPLGYFLFAGYNAIVYFAGEIREVKKNVPLALIGACFVGLAFWVAFTWLYTYHFVGWDFNNAAAWLWSTGSDKYPFPQPPSIMYFMEAITRNPVLLLILELTFWANINIIFAWYVANVRFVFALAFDRLLPSKLAEVSERTNTPIIATIIIGVLVELVSIVYTTSNFLSLYANITLMFAIVFTIVGFACAFLPLKKEFYNRLLISKYKLGSLPLITIVGLINGVLFGYLTYSAFVIPGMTTLAQVYLLVGVFVLGVVWYYVAKAYWARRGLDLGLVYKQVPPE
jgi:APA family basic amino acid/polyamine antiporter